MREPNLDKLVSWDIDLYNELSDETCLICLSEKDRYVLGQALRQVRWHTRWWSLYGNTPIPDTNDIADRLQPLMSNDSCIDICEIMITCIENTPELQQLIAQYSSGGQTGYTDPENTSILGLDVFDGTAVGCENDNIFGMVTGLVDLLNDISTDLLEMVQAAPNAIARIGDIIEAIPIIGEAPADDALQLAEKLAEDIAQNYESAYTVTFRDNLRCDLFCLATDNCDLDIEIVRDFIQSKLLVAVTSDSFEDVVQQIFEENWLGEQTIWVMHWMILQLMIFGGKITDVDANRLVLMVSALYNDPDPDWSILCDCPDDTEQCWSWVGGSNGWTDSSSTSEFIATGLRMRTNQQYAVGSLRFTPISPENIDTPEVNSITVSWDASAANVSAAAPSVTYVQYWYTDDSNEILQAPNLNLPATGYVGDTTYSIPASDPNKILKKVSIQCQKNSGNSGTLMATGICLSKV